MTDDRSVLDVLRGSRILAYSVGALTLIAGVVLLFWPGRTIVVVARLAGILLIAVGIGESLEAVTSHRKGNYWGLLLIRGLLNLGAGALLVFWPGVTITVLVWIFGIDLILAGIVGIFASRGVPAELGRSGFLLRGIVGIAVGAIVIIWPQATLLVMAVLVAIQLIVIGLILVWSGWQLSRIEKDPALRQRLQQ
jgi:uncharacterized membrane protein HdeD (DUF308 family)